MNRDMKYVIACELIQIQVFLDTLYITLELLGYRKILSKSFLYQYLEFPFYALFIALAGPLSTVIFILSIVKINETRTKKVQRGDING